METWPEVRLHFPTSLAVSCGYMIKFQPMGYKWKADMAAWRRAVLYPPVLFLLHPLFLASGWNVDSMDEVQATILRHEVKATY